MKSICSREPDVALTSIAATLGAALSSWGEQALVPVAGERGAGVSVAGHTPSGANTHSAGRGTPLAVMLREPERDAQLRTEILTSGGGKREEGAERQRDEENCALWTREICISKPE